MKKILSYIASFFAVISVPVTLIIILLAIFNVISVQSKPYWVLSIIWAIINLIILIADETKPSAFVFSLWLIAIPIVGIFAEYTLQYIR